MGSENPKSTPVNVFMYILWLAVENERYPCNIHQYPKYPAAADRLPAALSLHWKRQEVARHLSSTTGKTKNCFHIHKKQYYTSRKGWEKENEKIQAVTGTGVVWGSSDSFIFTSSKLPNTHVCHRTISSERKYKYCNVRECTATGNVLQPLRYKNHQEPRNPTTLCVVTQRRCSYCVDEVSNKIGSPRVSNKTPSRGISARN